VRHKDIDCTIRIFLWKLLNGVHKCGEYWLNIPGFEQRSKCQTCGVPESMEHILTDCDVPGQEIIWSLAKNLWLKKHKHWPNVTNIGNITGCSLIEVRNQHGQRRNGAERLFRIVITESAYLIWKIRCHRVIEHGDIVDQWPTKNEIVGKWLCAINRRLALDQAMTNKRYGSRSIKKKTVLHTWSGTLQNEQSLPDDWIKHTRVLVGSVPPE